MSHPCDLKNAWQLANAKSINDFPHVPGSCDHLIAKVQAGRDFSIGQLGFKHSFFSIYSSMHNTAPPVLTPLVTPVIPVVPLPPPTVTTYTSLKELSKQVPKVFTRPGMKILHVEDRLSSHRRCFNLTQKQLQLEADDDLILWASFSDEDWCNSEQTAAPPFAAQLAPSTSCLLPSSCEVSMIITM